LRGVIVLDRELGAKKHPGIIELLQKLAPMTDFIATVDIFQAVIVHVPEYTAVTPLPHSILCSTLTFLPLTRIFFLGVIWNLCSSLLPFSLSTSTSSGAMYVGLFILFRFPVPSS
jgi:hypothetical protein